MDILVNSEIGKLEGVIVHTPGHEVENMTPASAERALYSDILNLTVASWEYGQFLKVLSRFSKTFEVKDLLTDILKSDDCKDNILNKICKNETAFGVKRHLFEMEPEDLARELIEGVPLNKDNLTNFLSSERYSLQPLHNFFFTRDSAVSVNDKVFISKLQSIVREREAIVMESIFNCHPEFRAQTVNPVNEVELDTRITIEGGDLLVAREDILLLGNGSRTSTHGIDFILEKMKENKERQHLIIQQLPHKPESFIHLDMVFTLLDRNACMVYEPVIFNRHDFETVHITIDNGKVTITESPDLLACLKSLGMEVEPILCGGDNDEWIQEREQWHSGANFFAVAPGKVMGYDRNVYTIEAMNKKGFEVFTAEDIIGNKKNPDDYERVVITIEGSELARGGGGCRCMTMPVKRKDVE